MSNLDRDLYEFGEFRFDASSRVLWVGEDTVDVGPKALEVLALLIERRGDLVERSEIIERVWADTFVEEGNLNHAISALRKSLGDPSFIKTIPRRGYRFTPPVRLLRADDQRKIVIEQRSVTNTVIEEDEDDEPLMPHPVSSAAVNAAYSSRFALIGPALAGGVLVIFLTAGWYLSWTPGLKYKDELGTVNSLAVLKMRSFDQSNSNEELRLRITDALITKLASGSRFSVRPTDSVMRLADTEAVEAGRRLGVDAVLDGRVQAENGRLRVTLQLINVGTGENMWSAAFDGREGEILALQDSISARLREELPFFASAKIPKLLTENSEAYELYLKGRFLWNQRTESAFRRALEFFERSVELDPEFALGYTGIADCYYLLHQRNGIDKEVAYVKAEAAVERALAIAPDLAEAHAARGSTEFISRLRLDLAERSFLRAIELDPNYAEAYARYGMMLNAQRRFDEAYDRLKTAERLDPTSINIGIYIGVNLYFSRRFDESITQFNRVLEFNPGTERAHSLLSRIYELTGQYDLAVEHALKERQVWRPETVEPLRAAYDSGGIRRYWQKQVEFLLQEAESGNGGEMYVAGRYVLLGDIENALKFVKSDLDRQGHMALFGHVDPIFDPIRDDVRFRDLFVGRELLGSIPHS
jgi:DNA-binding winged helix-turn-helix (wHTH) protein/tetratricopeptide (TPR) repeat protein